MRTITVAIATWREAIRQPVSILTLIIAAVVTFLAQFLNFYHFSADVGVNTIRQMSVASTLMCGVVIAVFTASAVLAEEIENRTVLTLLAKPVRRYELILGKFLGIMMAISAAFVVMVGISLLTTWWAEVDQRVKRRGNPALAVKDLPAVTAAPGAVAVASSYRDALSRRGTGADYLQSVGDVMMLSSGQSSLLLARAPLSADLESPQLAGKWQPSPGLGSLVDRALWFAGTRMASLLQAFALAFAHVLVMAAVAVAVSTRLPLVFNALFCSAVFILGNISRGLARALLETETAEGVLGAVSQVAMWPVIAVCYLLPNFENFNLTEPLAVGIDRIPAGAWIYGLLYGIVYAGLVLAIAVELFRRREVA